MAVNGDAHDEHDEQFTIPTLPRGGALSLTCVSNWGDPAACSIHAVELFADDGHIVAVQQITCTAAATEGSAERVFAADAPTERSTHFRTTRPCPFTFSAKLERTASIAMVRIWNYSPSRVHSTCNVRKVELTLDERLIFRGEIGRGGKAPEGDTILFTTDEVILGRIAENDQCMLEEELEEELDEPPQDPLLLPVSTRPPTCERVATASTRPATQTTTSEGETLWNKCKVFHMTICSTWGTPDTVGLTGLEFVGAKGELASTQGAVIQWQENPDDTTVQRLLNGRNLTRSPADSWMAPFDASAPPTLTVTFPHPVALSGISVWNLNISCELSYSGARCCQLFVNGRSAGGNVLLRKAPGLVLFDFVQDVPFSTQQARAFRPQTRTLGGFIFQLRLLSTWGDEFYTGLNGIELYNRRDQLIKLRSHNLACFPESVNILPSVEGDPRVSTNLIDGVNDTDKPSHQWLTPLLPNRCARVFVVFDRPTFVSRIVIYNYRKTPLRGVRHCSLSVDDFIVFSGEIPKSSEIETGKLEISLRETNS